MNAKVTISVVGALLVALSTGCASKQTPAVAPAQGVEDVAIVTAPAGPPDQVEMTWQDSGSPIRPLSAPGRERELAHPVTANVHRGGLTVAPPSNADGFGGAKKKTPKK